MKILISALACEPGKGSELEVGFRALKAAASHHEVWLLTNSASVSIVRRAIEPYPWANRVHLEGIYFDVDEYLYPRLTAPGFHWYYDRWQRKAAERAVELERRIDFDVVHHVSLAANWTRAGVTAVDKPLVWGPVGGGVELPFSLIGELGWDGVFDEAVRFLARRLLVRVGPARSTKRRATVIFAQNQDTARLMGRDDSRVRVLSNATSVDVCDVEPTGTRRKDIVLAARLLPWKGGQLAVRSLRYVRHPAAVLRIFGEGPEQQRIARAAHRWGVTDRVQFEGRVNRAGLLRTVATAGVFLHPAFHDEAGLAVAEALSLGTPVVCLDRGGPPELLRYWPDAPADVISPQSPDKTARAIAASIDRFLFDAPPVRSTPHRAVISFDEELLAAYRTAFAHRSETRHAKVWAFPLGKPQLFTASPRSLSEGVMVYGFGRRRATWMQIALAWQVRVPGVRRLFTERKVEEPPVCGWKRWHHIEENVRQRNGLPWLSWVHFRSQWGKERSSMLGLDGDGEPRGFVVVEPQNRETLTERLRATRSFRVATCLDSFCDDRWSVRLYEPLPRLHRPARWNASRIRRVSEEVSHVLEGLLPRVEGIPSHWRPMHGDFVPWNLREDSQGQLWLLDWEDAGWGPPLADLVRYAVAYHSLGWNRPARIAAVVAQTVGVESLPALAEVASFWLSHRNIDPEEARASMTRRRAKESARAARELAALRAIGRVAPTSASSVQLERKLTSGIFDGRIK
jgi:glycosyltransferase involved in cell wall biosynthesis/thiamine kinase-like enzyme